MGIKGGAREDVGRGEASGHREAGGTKGQWWSFTRYGRLRGYFEFHGGAAGCLKQEVDVFRCARRSQRNFQTLLRSVGSHDAVYRRELFAV